MFKRHVSVAAYDVEPLDNSNNLMHQASVMYCKIKTVDVWHFQENNDC